MSKSARTNMEAEPTSGVVIRLGLSGIFSVEIVARESAEEEDFLKQLHAARPVLELLHAGVRAQE